MPPAPERSRISGWRLANGQKLWGQELGGAIGRLATKPCFFVPRTRT
jgi:hypothetical protein